MIDYTHYLTTSHWKEVRREALHRAGHKCQLCGKNNRRLNVHHNAYDTLWNESHQDVVVLCEPCHKKHHGIVPEPPPHVAVPEDFWPVVVLSDGREIHHPLQLKKKERAYFKKTHREASCAGLNT